MTDSPLLQACSAPLAEKYRPLKWADVIGQDKIVTRLTRMAARTGLAGRAYWLSGPRGAGKSTLAYLIAGEVADPLCIKEWPVGKLTESAVIALAEDLAPRMLPFGDKTGKVVIVNEAHKLREDAITALLDAIDPRNLPAHVVWIFTAPSGETQKDFLGDHADAQTLMSRCIKLELSERPGADLIAARLREAAIAEGLDGRPIEQYKRLVMDNRNNWRACYQAIEAGEMLP